MSIDPQLDIGQELRDVLNLVEKDPAFSEPIEKAVGILAGKAPLERIVEADVVCILAQLFLKQSRLTGLARSGNENGWELPQGFSEARGEASRAVHLTILKLKFGFVNRRNRLS